MEDNSHAGKANEPHHAEHAPQQQPRFQRRRTERLRRRTELRERGGGGGGGRGGARKGLEGINPLAALVEVGDELRARAQRMLQARGREMQGHGGARRGGGGLGLGLGLGRRNSLAFGNFLARKEEPQEGKEEPRSAEMLAVSPPPVFSLLFS